MADDYEQLATYHASWSSSRSTGWTSVIGPPRGRPSIALRVARRSRGTCAASTARRVLGTRQTTFPRTIAALGVVIGVLAAIVPARRAAKLDSLATLRNE